GVLLQPAARHPGDARRQDGGPGDLLRVLRRRRLRGRQVRTGAEGDAVAAGSVRQGAQGREGAAAEARRRVTRGRWRGGSLPTTPRRLTSRPTPGRCRRGCRPRGWSRRGRTGPRGTRGRSPGT